jgi:3-dehydroquinate synthetase
VAHLLSRLGLPIRLQDELNLQSVLQLMARDKKNRSRRIHMALPARLGEMHRQGDQWTTPVSFDDIVVGLAAVSSTGEPARTLPR